MSFEGKIGLGGPVVLTKQGSVTAPPNEEIIMRRPMGALSVIDGSGIHHTRIIDRMRRSEVGDIVNKPRIFGAKGYAGWPAAKSNPAPLCR